MLEDYKEEIAHLKQQNARFAKLLEEHQKLNELIDKANRKKVNLSNDEIEQLKRKKLLFKDEMYHMIIEFKKDRVEA
jgi:uncharacterized protein YdcH (DUF465 family)